MVHRFQGEGKREPGIHLPFDLGETRHGTEWHIENQWIVISG
jgi:hypothetical protein